MPPVPVADPDDPRVALYRGVRDPDLLRDHGVFLAEGRLVVQRLLRDPRFRIRSLLVSPAALHAMGEQEPPATLPIFVASPEVMSGIAGFNVHRGCLAIAERPGVLAVADLISSAGPLLVLEAVGNPDNVGGAFRNAAAFGATGVLLSPGCADPLYRKSIRTSMGATLTVPWTAADPWPDVLKALTAAGWAVVALTLSPGARDLDVVGPELAGARIALLLGHEGHGLTPAAERLATHRARIPIADGSDSLNVAAAAAVALYEIRRRR